MVKYRIFQALVIGFIAACVWVLTPAPDANAAATCANVRCASGTCIDTPAGPTCTQQLTCASTLCQVGSTCQETPTGPTCVPNSTPPSYGNPNYGGHVPGYGHKPKNWRRYYQPGHKRPYRPRRHHYNNPYTPPQPVDPLPTDPQDMVCASIYQPVCAERQVQCFTHPCRPVRQHFSNSCEAKKAGYKVVHQGVCRAVTPRRPVTPRPMPPREPEKKFCTSIYQPVCAQKRVPCTRGYCPPKQRDFGNACEANNAGYTVIKNGVCSPIPRRPLPPTNQDGRVCPSIYQPVCGRKQVQCFRAPCPAVEQNFSNSCEAGKAGYDIAYNGVCR